MPVYEWNEYLTKFCDLKKWFSCHRGKRNTYKLLLRTFSYLFYTFAISSLTLRLTPLQSPLNKKKYPSAMFLLFDALEQLQNFRMITNWWTILGCTKHRIKMYKILKSFHIEFRSRGHLQSH